MATKEKYSEERRRDYPTSTRIAEMADAGVEDMLDMKFNTAQNARESVGKFGKGLGRYGTAAAAYIPAMAVDEVKRAFRKKDGETKDAEGKKAGGIIKSSASKRADGCAIKGKTRGKMVKMNKGGRTC